AYECAGQRPTSLAGLLHGAIQYALTGRGLFASNVCDAAAIVRLDADSQIPNVRILLRWRVLPNYPTCVADLEVTSIDPASRGSVTLASADPMRTPRIDPAYLTAAVDADVLRRGVELAREIAATAPCRAAGIGTEVLPGVSHALAHIRRQADT